MSDATCYTHPVAFETAPASEHEERYLGPGVVAREEVDGPSRVEVTLPWEEGRVEAEVAVAGAGRLRRGQRVLVSLTAGGGAYVVGLLGESRSRLSARNGATARLVEEGDGERLEVRDPEGALIFAYDPDRGGARLHVPDGDLEVSAPGGDLVLGAGKAVRVEGRTIDLAARSSVRAFVGAAASGIASSIRLGRQSTRVDTDTLRVTASRGDVSVERVRLTGDRVDTEVAELHTTAERIRTTAEKVTQRFGSLCRRVAELVQTRAGRVRQLVSGSWHARAERADLRTEETFKVDGKKIHLG